MSIELLRAFFGWCTVINGGVLLLTFLVHAAAGDWVFRMHNRWFPITKEAFTLAMYCFVGGMKILFVMLSLVPYVVLVIVG